jgi:hypothetical protein
VNPDAAEPTLFDSLARLVPTELQAAYHRVLAHTRELGPDDEMLRILEAMGVLVLLTRQTPMAMAQERAELGKMLTQHEQFTREMSETMAVYRNGLEARITALPKEVERSLNPSGLAKLLSESIRQQLFNSGLPKTAETLQASSEMIAKAEMNLVAALDKLCDHRFGVLAQVESANRSTTDSLESRASQINALLLDVRRDVLRIWVPMLCGASLVLGLISGAGLQNWRDRTANDEAVTQTSRGEAPPVPESNCQAAGEASRNRHVEKPLQLKTQAR